MRKQCHDERFLEGVDDKKNSRKRRRQQKRRTSIIWRSIDVIMTVLTLFLVSSSDQPNELSPQHFEGSSFFALALLSRTKLRQRQPIGKIKTPSILLSDASTSPLFSNRKTKPSPTKFVDPMQSKYQRRKTRQQNNPRSLFTSRTTASSVSSPTALHMVLTTPESIIEQASTVNLLDDLINESVRTSARRPIMMQFDPSSGWIWRRWKGTVFAETWTSCSRNVLLAMAVFLIHRTYPTIFKTYLSGFNTLWGQLLSVTTFTLTFFVNQSYALWRKCMELSRRLQGRLHDVHMNMASHAERVIPSNPNEKSTYTLPARQILELMSRYARLFNLLMYASFTRSHRPILTPRGLRRLVERGLMTTTEHEVLTDAVIPATQRHSVVLMWMIRLFVEGRASGHIQGGHGFESETMHKFHIIRSQYGAIGDELQGRMPLAYAHIVQVLVDLILWMFPVMAFSIDMSPVLVILGTSLLTVSYQGLFDLAKQFLDPYDNESYGRGEDPLCVDTLIAETNAGSIRWLYGFEELPFSVQRLNDGELYEYLLPVRGYSVEELDEMERERIEREKLLEEQRRREDEEAAAEAERLRKEAEEQQETRLNEDEEEVIAIENEGSIQIDTNKKNITIVDVPETFDARVTESIGSEDINVIEGITEAGNETGLEIDKQNGTPIFETTSNATTSPVSSEEMAVDIDEKPVHTVTTLATDGSLISSFKPSQPAEPAEPAKPVKESSTPVESVGETSVPVKAVEKEPVPSGMQASNYLATLRRQNERIKSLLAAADFEEDEMEEELIDFSAYEDLPWFDEVGSDGQELRLSQQLADEIWVDETDDVEIKTMTKEEYENRIKEIEENAENELKETIEIMSATPGDGSDETLYTVTERRKKKAPNYDQTRLDGISQLWGLPPEDPSALSEYEPPEKVDDADFSSISQLWGGSGMSDASVTTSSQNTRQDESDIVGMESFAGISELWGPTLNDFQDDIDGRDIDLESLDDADLSDEIGQEDSTDVGGSFAGIPWHDERGPDGKEYRLSEMLADEEWVNEEYAEESTAMTLEDYNKQVEEITEKLEEELRETEAILLSKPGTDPLGWDYDDEQLTPMSNVTNIEEGAEKEDIEIKNKTVIEDADLSVLEMDVEVTEESNFMNEKIDVAAADDADSLITDTQERLNDDTENRLSPNEESDDDSLDKVASKDDIVEPILLENNEIEEVEHLENEGEEEDDLRL